MSARQRELWIKFNIVLKHFASGANCIEKIKMHVGLVHALRHFKRRRLILFRAYFIYILPYLSKSLEISQKYRILLNHYSFIKQQFSFTHLCILFAGGIECYHEVTDAKDKYSIFLKSVRNHLEAEGSMNLLFKLNGTVLFTLGFTFAPGYIFNLDDSQIIYVSSIQGTKNQHENIKAATKYFKDNAIPAMLLKALETIAGLMHINTCICISVNDQLAFKDKSTYDRFYNNYDAFWMNSGATFLNDNYILDLPLKQKPILEISQPHRNRTLKKRKKIQNVCDVIADYMRPILEENGENTSVEAEVIRGDYPMAHEWTDLAIRKS